MSLLRTVFRVVVLICSSYRMIIQAKIDFDNLTRIIVYPVCRRAYPYYHKRLPASSSPGPGIHEAWRLQPE